MFKGSIEHEGLQRTKNSFLTPGTCSLIDEIKKTQNDETSAKVWSNEEEGNESDKFFHAITWSFFSVVQTGNGGWMTVEHGVEMVLHCLL